MNMVDQRCVVSEQTAISVAQQVLLVTTWPVVLEANAVAGDCCGAGWRPRRASGWDSTQWTTQEIVSQSVWLLGTATSTRV